MTAQLNPNPRSVFLALFISLLMLVGFASATGCASTGEATDNQAFVLAGEARATAIKTLTGLNNAGFISPEDYEEIDAAIEITGIALDLWHEALLEGRPTGAAKKQFYRGYETFRLYQEPSLE